MTTALTAGKPFLRSLTMPLHEEVFSSNFYPRYEEYLRHPVFRAARAVAMKAAQHRCVECAGPATEVHHLRYPPWGTFDVPSHLRPVCHPCHCTLEGKAT